MSGSRSLGTTGRWPAVPAPGGAAAETRLPGLPATPQAGVPRNPYLFFFKESLSNLPGGRPARRLGEGCSPPWSGAGNQARGSRILGGGEGRPQGLELTSPWTRGRNDTNTSPPREPAGCVTCPESGAAVTQRLDTEPSGPSVPGALTTRGGAVDRAAKRHRGQVSLVVPLLQEAFQVPQQAKCLCRNDTLEWPRPQPRLPVPPIPERVRSGHWTSVY